MNYAILGIALGLFVSGCGSSQSPSFVTHVQIVPSNIGGDSYLSVIASLNTGAVQLPAVEIPIIDRNDPTHIYGSVALRPLVSGGVGTELVASINMSQAIHAQSGDALLPNGTPLPVGGLGNATVMSFPIRGTHGEVYLAIGPGVAMVGIAMTINQLNGVGFPLNFFPRFDFGNGVVGVAGIFTGVAPETSGIAFFVDVNTVTTPAHATLAAASVAGISSASRAAGPELPARSQLIWRDVVSNNVTGMRKLQSKMDKLNKKRVRLELN